MFRPEVSLSPPEINVDTIGLGPSTIPYSAPWDHRLQPNDTEPFAAHFTPDPEPSPARFRKISSIPYLTSGLKDSRERAPQRSLKPFVIIIPPASLIHQHGQLGHTLASGPRHRLSNGLLMPLFPTMYGQLTAIAREFNFPSTTGLCLYFHFIENGVTMTPRISDETWSFIWAHVFETSSASKFPISGKIEFDLDMHQARWHAAWLSSSLRENIEHSFSVLPSAAPSITHERGDSKSTVQEEDQEMSGSIVPETRHVPRKLSLVDRLETIPAGAGFRSASRTGLSPPEHSHPSSSRILSPIFQDEEPKTTRQALDDRVNSWRSSATSFKPTSLGATGQTSLETTNMSNFLLTDNALLEMPNEQINLEDFAWSVTSVGPDDYDPMSPASYDWVPSVHIANRMEGSVCLTPSDRTSFGPSDYTPTSPAPSMYRLPSPDMAHRMFEDAPQTPSIATTWGAPTEAPPSPAFFSRPPSIDLGERMIFSEPVTPTTATSWGPASWPSSPVYSEDGSRSIHLADRGDFSRPVTPSTITSWDAPLSWPPSPATPFYVTTPDAGHRGFEDTEYELGRNPVFRSFTIDAHGSSSTRISIDTPWGHSWPSHSRTSSDNSHQRRTVPWTHIWPYRKFDHASPSPTPQISAHVPSIYPHLVIYQPVYPHFDLYPGVTLVQGSSSGYPAFRLYPDVSPHTTGDTLTKDRSISVRLTPCYPAFDLYPAVYPENLSKIYPPAFVYNLSAGLVESVSTPSFVDPYPASRSVPSQRTPVCDLKASGYPYFDLYPSVRSISISRISEAMKPVPIQVKIYPFLTIYPAVYPDFNIYPPLTLPTPARPTGCSVRLATYPVFDLYPAVYPAFEIYPRVERANSPANDEVASGVPGYPQTENYLFPSAQEVLSRKSQSVRVQWSYPTFNLYQSVYPFLELYPPFPRDISSLRAPKFAGYPNFDLYSEHAHSLKVLPNTIDRAEHVYPIFNLYPAVYPYFDIYPAIAGTVESKEATQPTTGIITVKVQPNYPAFSLYSAVYPHFELWPLMDLPLIELGPEPRVKPLYKLSHKESHATVMDRTRSTSVKLNRLNTRSNSHADLHNAVFPDGIVTTSSGTWNNDSLIDVTLKSISSSEDPRRQASALQPNKAKLPLPASPGPIRHRYPPPSENRDGRRVIGFESAQEETSPQQRRQASSWQFPQDVGPRQLSSLNRSSSLMNGSWSELGNTSRPNSVSVASPLVSPPRRRDSLVSHRARVYNGSRDGIAIKLPTMEIHSKFSTPPIPPVPRAPPKPLDNLK